MNKFEIIIVFRLDYTVAFHNYPDYKIAIFLCVNRYSISDSKITFIRNWFSIDALEEIQKKNAKRYF